MPRRHRDYAEMAQVTTAAIGATDTAVVIDLVTPFAGARVLDFTVTSKTAGVGTGSGTWNIVEMIGVTTTVTSTTYTALTNNLTVDPDAVTGYVHGSAAGNGTQVAVAGNRLAVVSTKTGTFSTGIVALVAVTWQM
jgi:hypothetical protein